MFGYSNCLFFVIATAWRRRKFHGEYLLMRMSRYGYFPHFLWKTKHHIISYKPLNPEIHKLPPLLFKGKMTWGDAQVKEDFCSCH